MDPNAIFGLQFLFSLTVFSLLARWYLAPRLAGQPLEVALAPLLVPHALRHVGLLFLVPGVVAQPLPDAFSTPAAYGDFASAALAVLALVALRHRWSVALALVWVFSAVGTLDLLYALGRGFSVGAQLSMGATWVIPTFVVPALLVSHVMIWRRLLGSDAAAPTQLRSMPGAPPRDGAGPRRVPAPT